MEGVSRWETFLSLTKASLAGKSSHLCTLTSLWKPLL